MKMPNFQIKSFVLYVILPSVVLLASELLYRWIFDIVPLSRWWEELAYIAVFTSLLFYSRWNAVKCFVFLFFVLSFVVNNVHYEVYQSWVNGVNYYLAVAEWSEVLHTGITMVQKLIPGILWGGANCLLLVFVWRKSIQEWGGVKQVPIADILFVVLLAFICIRSFDTRQEHGISPKATYGNLKSNYFSLGYCLGRVVPYKLFDLSIVKDYETPVPQVISRPQVEHIVLVVGESESAMHVSAFGYGRHTTPFFEEVKSSGSALLMPSYSAALMTRVSLPTFFNAIAKPNGMTQIMKGTTNLFRLAQEQGFETHWYSAQASNEMNIMNLIGSKWLNHVTYPEAFGFSSRESMPDERLFEKFDEVNFDSKPQFVVLHQRGSHSPYGSLLTPRQANRFGGTTLDKYDATIYQTDQFIRAVADKIKAKELKNWLLLYTSDHGAFVTDKVYNQGTRKADSYTVPLYVTTDNVTLMKELKEVFSPCSTAFHQQVSTMLMKVMGYDTPISGCSRGVVNAHLLTGDSGYIEIESDKATFVTPN